MKKRIHRIRLKHFRDQGETQTYYLQKELFRTYYLVAITELEQKAEGKWLITLEDGSKEILTDNDFIHYIKKEK